MVIELLVALSVTPEVPAPDPRTAYTDEQIKELIVKDSVEAYPGACPCPYSRDIDGRFCVDHDAYTKSSGLKPMCYERDVQPYLIKSYRRKHSIPE